MKKSPAVRSLFVQAPSTRERGRSKRTISEKSLPLRGTAENSRCETQDTRKTVRARPRALPSLRTEAGKKTGGAAFARFHSLTLPMADAASKRTKNWQNKKVETGAAGYGRSRETRRDQFRNFGTLEPQQFRNCVSFFSASSQLLQRASSKRKQRRLRTNPGREGRDNRMVEKKEPRKRSCILHERSEKQKIEDGGQTGKHRKRTNHT